MTTEASAVVKYAAGDLKAAEDNVALVWGAQNCPPAVRTQVARITLAYGLDPFLRHIEILGGRPYVTHAGLLYYAHRTGRLGSITCRPLTADEREALKAEMKEREIWRCAEIQIDAGERFGIITLKGYAKAGGPGEASSVANGYHSFTIAEKRAINRTLRLAFSIGIPSTEEMGAEQYDLPMGGEAAPPKEARQSRVEAKLRKIQPDEKPSEVIQTTAETVTSPPEEPAPEPAPEEAPVTPPAGEPSTVEEEERLAVVGKLKEMIEQRLNKARTMIFRKQVLGNRDIDSLTLDEAALGVQTLNTKAWGGGQ